MNSREKKSLQRISGSLTVQGVCNPHGVQLPKQSMLAEKQVKLKSWEMANKKQTSVEILPVKYMDIENSNF